MERQRKQYTAAFKAKVALEAVKGQRTVQELASNYGIHPNQITNWKKQLVAEAAEIFTRSGVHGNEAVEQEKAELYQQIGKLQVELDWLQKKSVHRTGSPKIERRAAVRTDRTAALDLVLRAAERDRRKSTPDATLGRAIHAHAILRQPAHGDCARRARLQCESQARPTAHAEDGHRGDLSKAAIIRSCTRASGLSIPAARPDVSPSVPDVRRS